MALVDYKGFRLIAMSILPLNGSKSLKYGSNDAGDECNVHTDSEALTQKISEASQKMNLKGHWCGKVGRDKFLYSAIDLEGHISKEDNRMYVIDYSRTMPPVYPKGNQGGLYGQQYFCLFRSEFVRYYEKPLCADGYSGFQSRDDKINNTELRDATVHLIKVKIPQASKDLEKSFNEHLNSNKSILKFSISGNMHTYGINMRYAGYVLEALTEDGPLFNLLLVEIIARIVKNRLRQLMRKKLEKVKAPLEAPFNILIINHLNGLFSGDRAQVFLKEKSNQYWEKHIPAQLHPLFKINDERAKKLGNLKDRISKIKFDQKTIGKYVLLHRIIDMMGLKFTNDILEEIEKNAEIFELNQIFEYTNLKDIGVRVKHMNIIETIQAEMFLTYYLHRGKLQVSDKEALRHYEKALEAIEEEVKKRPNDLLLVIKFANIINRVEKAQYRIKKQKKKIQLFEELPQLKRANNYYEQVIQKNPTETSFLTEYAQYLNFWEQFSKAEIIFLNSLEIDPNQTEALNGFASLLKDTFPKYCGHFKARADNINSQQEIIKRFMSKQIKSEEAVLNLRKIDYNHEKDISGLSHTFLKSSLSLDKFL